MHRDCRFETEPGHVERIELLVEGAEDFVCDRVLLATGRVANTDGLGLDAIGKRGLDHPLPHSNPANEPFHKAGAGLTIRFAGARTHQVVAQPFAGAADPAGGGGAFRHHPRGCGQRLGDRGQRDRLDLAEDGFVYVEVDIEPLPSGAEQEASALDSVVRLQN